MKLRSFITSVFAQNGSVNQDSRSEPTPMERERQASTETNAPVLIFTHIPKTGGGSLTQIFRENFLPEQVLDLSHLKLREQTNPESILSEELKHVAQTVKVVHGHVNFCFGVQQHFRREVVNLTILRDPVHRFVSLYYFVRALKNGNKIAEEIVNKGLTLDDFAGYETFQPLDNVMVRYLANSTGRNENLGKTDRHLLQEAKANLLKYFALFGVTEEFDVLAERVCNRFNLSKGTGVRLNASGKPELEEISSKTLNTIRVRNSFDQELWEFARIHSRFG